MSMRARSKGWTRGVALVATAGLLSLGAVTVGATPAGAATPMVSVGDTAIYEGDSGPRIARVMVSLDVGAPAEGVTVYWAAQAGSATSPADFKVRGGKLVFKPGQSTRHAQVKIKPDVAIEGDESFTVSAVYVIGATVADGTGVVTILDEEGGSGNVASIGSATVVEGDTGAYQYVFVPVTLRTAPGTTVTVGYSTGGGSASTPDDYVGRTGTLTFPAKARVRWALVYLTPDDADEANETFDITLSGPTNATIGDGTGTVTIVDDD